MPTGGAGHAPADLKYARLMQRTATQVFVVASIAFGVIGALYFIVVFATGWPDWIGETVFALWGVSGCAVLSSFGVAVAGKYLADDS